MNPLDLCLLTTLWALSLKRQFPLSISPSHCSSTMRKKICWDELSSAAVSALDWPISLYLAKPTDAPPAAVKWETIMKNSCSVYGKKLPFSYLQSNLPHIKEPDNYSITYRVIVKLPCSCHKKTSCWLPLFSLQIDFHWNHRETLWAPTGMSIAISLQCTGLF